MCFINESIQIDTIRTSTTRNGIRVTAAS